MSVSFIAPSTAATSTDPVHVGVYVTSTCDVISATASFGAFNSLDTTAVGSARSYGNALFADAISLFYYDDATDTTTLLHTFGGPPGAFDDMYPPYFHCALTPSLEPSSPFKSTTTSCPALGG